MSFSIRATFANTEAASVACKRIREKTTDGLFIKMSYSTPEAHLQNNLVYLQTLGGQQFTDSAEDVRTPYYTPEGIMGLPASEVREECTVRITGEGDKSRIESILRNSGGYNVYSTKK